jgi:hypothetical protein
VIVHAPAFQITQAVGQPTRAARRNDERTTIRWNGAIARI